MTRITDAAEPRHSAGAEREMRKKRKNAEHTELHANGAARAQEVVFGRKRGDRRS